MNSMVTCSTEEMGAGDFVPLLRINGLVLSGGIMGVYAIIWFMVFKMKSTSKSVLNLNLKKIIKDVNTASKKLVKALVFMIVFNLLGVFLRLR